MNLPTELGYGDFSGLADDYSTARPSYAPEVLHAMLGLMRKAVAQLDIVDVGAGTGIFTRQLAAVGSRSVVAIEPNDDMRRQGIADSEGTCIEWRKGNGVETGLADRSADLLTMASSFHWVDFEKGTAEFRRVLRPGGWFAALWNPRYIEASPLLMEIEDHLRSLAPDMTRVSSGRAGLSEGLTELLCGSPNFDRVVYLEGRHVEMFSHERYIRAWRSVNDVQRQLGAARFEAFLNWIEDRIAREPEIEATYLTRAWVARRK